MDGDLSTPDVSRGLLAGAGRDGGNEDTCCAVLCQLFRIKCMNHSAHRRFLK